MKGKRFLSLLLCFVMVLGMLPGLAIPASAASTATLQFFVVMGNTSTSNRIRKTKVPINSKVKDAITSDELVEKNPGYYGVMELVDWYTEQPEENEDGSFTFSEEAKVTDDTLVTRNLKLYAKTKIREGQTISISLNGYKPKPITEWSGPVATSPSERFLFDVTNKTNIKYDGTTENISKSLLELPLGKALTADDLSKIPSQWTIDSQAYTINSWATVSTVLTVGTVIDPQDKIDRYNGEGYDPFEVYAQMTWPITIKFVTNVDGKTLQDINLTGATKLNGYSAATTNTMTEAQKKQVADVNTWVQQQENTDGFGRIFRGWYANSSFTGDPFRDGTGYSISGTPTGLDENSAWHANTPFNNSMTLYAKWEDRCKVTFNMGSENLSNAASFTDYYVAVNEKLTAPSVEPQSTGYPNRVFLGWYEDAECTKVWDFANKTVRQM